MMTRRPEVGFLAPEEVTTLVDEHFPQINAGGRSMYIQETGPDKARVRLTALDRDTRPGGTVSGPTLFRLADFAVYVALIARLGPAALDSVTSSLNITFLKRPDPQDILAEARLLRVGRRLAYATVEIRSAATGDVIAHAVTTFALPDARA